MKHTVKNVVVALCIVAAMAIPMTCQSVEQPYAEIEQHFSVTQVSGSNVVVAFGGGHNVIFQTDGNCRTYKGAAGIMNLGPTWGYLLFGDHRCNIYSISRYK